MQEVQPTRRSLAARVAYELRRRPGPAKQVRGNGGVILMVASHVAITLIGGSASAVLTSRSRCVRGPQKEKVMSAVRRTLILIGPVPFQVLLWTFTSAVGEQRGRPGPAKQILDHPGTGVTVASDAATGRYAGHAIASHEQAAGIWQSATAAPADPASVPRHVIANMTLSPSISRIGNETQSDRRHVAFRWKYAETISAQPIGANCRWVSSSELRLAVRDPLDCGGLRDLRLAAARLSPPAPKRWSAVRRRHHLATGAFDARRAAQISPFGPQ